MFRRKFKNNVKNVLIRWNEKLKNCNQSIETTIELDDKLYKKVEKKRYNESREKIDSFTKYFNEREKISRSNNYKQNKIDYFEFMSMKSNFTQRMKKKSFRNKQQSNRNNKKYYACDKSNHFVRNCRSKKLIFQRQINATLKMMFEIDKFRKKIVYSKYTKNSKNNSNDDYYLINESKKFKEIINRMNALKTNEIIDILKRILDNNVIIKKNLDIERLWSRFTQLNNIFWR